MEDFETLEDIENKYRELSAILIERIAERDHLIGLLKIAHPSKIAELREGIARFDQTIESCEKYIESIANLRTGRIALEKSLAALQAKTDEIKPILLKHIAEHHPEKLEEVELLFSNEDKSKTH